jgi:SAM-dependent methyltransferase
MHCGKWRNGTAMTDERARAVNEHYGRTDLGEVILEELRAAGIDPSHPTTDQLAPYDQFHGGGKAATMGLLELGQLPRRSEILDIGGGYGGPARTVAEYLDARVTVLDFTEEFVRLGAMLTERTGLSAQVTHQHGDALNLPFPEASFDVVWMQNATMNLPDKPRLFQEIHRVLRPGGRLAMQDVLAGPVQPVIFPVAWAHDASMSFLRTEEDTRAMLTEAGFRDVVWQPAPPLSPSTTPSAGSKAAELVRHRDAEAIAVTRNANEKRVLTVWLVADRV